MTRLRKIVSAALPVAVALSLALPAMRPARGAVPEVAAPGSKLGEADAEGYFVDPERGGRFKVERLPKVDGTYRWVDENTIVLRYGLTLEVVDHDPAWLWVKVWESKRQAVAEVDRAGDEILEERTAASYRVDVRGTDRIELLAFDAGLPKTGQWRHGFDVADVDGDGHHDIVFGPPRKSTRPRPAIFLGDGKGHWRPFDATFPPLPYGYGDAAAGDLNGDGRTDLVFGIHLRGVLALISSGGGRFEPWSRGLALHDPKTSPPRRGSAAGFFSSRAVELFDWDGDGRLDILALGEGPGGQGPGRGARGEVRSSRGLLVYINQGDGSWAPRRPAEGGWLETHFGDGFALADFDGDGRADVALASRAVSRKSIVGLRATDGAWVAEKLDALPAYAFVGAVAASDVDADGSAELFVGYSNRDRDRVGRTGIDVFVRKSAEPEGWERRPLTVAEDRRGVYALGFGDLDGDRHPDLVALTGKAEVWIFFGDGRGNFLREAAPEAPPPAAGCRGYGVRLVDLDGDGADEIVAGFAGESSGFPGIAGHAGCPGGGSIRVWKAVARP